MLFRSMVVTKGVTFDFNTGTYNLSGNGGISGSGDVVKNGKGEVVVDLKNSDYTGKTIINEGTLTITNIDNSGRPSALGASKDADGIQLAGGTLKINATNMSTDRVINLVSDTSTINVFKQGGSLSLKSITKGNGYLVKDGAYADEKRLLFVVECQHVKAVACNVVTCRTYRYQK